MRSLRGGPPAQLLAGRLQAGSSSRRAWVMARGVQHPHVSSSSRAPPPPVTPAGAAPPPQQQQLVSQCAPASAGLDRQLQQQRVDHQQQQHQQQPQDSLPPHLTPAQGAKLPNQADQLWGDPNDRETRDVALVEPATTGSVADLDYLAELLAIQQSDGPKNLGFFGTRNMGMTHQKLVEILSYAMVSTGNHLYTSGATGTNAAVIKGALRAEKPDLLTVILPQSLSRQPAESQELLSQVQNVVEMPHNDELSLLEASRHCNREIISKVQQVICFAFHDSRLLLETCAEAKDSKKITTLFYLD